MAKKRNIESASVFERSGIRAIRVRAIEVSHETLTSIQGALQIVEKSSN